MIPRVSIDKTDGNLGITNATDRILAIIGPAAAGDENVAQAYTNKNDIVDAFSSGPLVRAGSYAVSNGVPVVLIRGTAGTEGSFGTIDDDGVTGTATVAAGSTHPDDDYDVIVEVLTGGALGTAGITFRYSLDAGSSWSQAQALGTSLTLTCANGVSFTLAASAATLIAGDTWSVRTKAPKIGTSDLDTAFAALSDYSGEWLRVLVIDDADATILAQCDTFAKSFHADGKYPEVIANTRYRGSAGTETRAAYQTALAAISAAVQSTEVSCGADCCEMVIDGLRLRRPVALPFAVRTLIINDAEDAAFKSRGALPAVFLTTADGASDYHDERRFPGLDDLGFVTLRTFGGRPRSPGAYVNNPRLLSGPTSDYQFFPLTAIVNRIIETTFQSLEPKLSMGVLLGPTGSIREDVAKAIEDSVSAELRTQFADPGLVSGVRCVLSRTDNVLSTNTISFRVDVQPLGYVKIFSGKTGLVRALPVAA